MRVVPHASGTLRIARSISICNIQIHFQRMFVPAEIAARPGDDVTRDFSDRF
jgi:hypothetical protein